MHHEHPLADRVAIGIGRRFVGRAQAAVGLGVGEVAVTEGRAALAADGLQQVLPFQATGRGIPRAAGEVQIALGRLGVDAQPGLFTGLGAIGQGVDTVDPYPQRLVRSRRIRFEGDVFDQGIHAGRIAGVDGLGMGERER